MKAAFQSTLLLALRISVFFGTNAQLTRCVHKTPYVDVNGIKTKPPSFSIPFCLTYVKFYVAIQGRWLFSFQNIAVETGSIRLSEPIFLVIDKKPVWSNVTLAMACIIPVKRMVVVLFVQQIA